MELALDTRARLRAVPGGADAPAVATAEAATDSELLVRVGDRDREAFEILYRRYVRSVFGLALRRLGDRSRAEDAVQETFTAVWRSAATLPAGARSRPAPWLYAVARNAIVDRPAGTRGPSSATRPTSSPASLGRRSRRSRRTSSWRVHRALEDASGAARARGDRARLLERAVAERGGELPRTPARHREDADAERARAARGRPGRRAAHATPRFDELVGPEVEGAERERLEHVHDLLVQAGPPPEIAPGLEGGPTLGTTLGRPRRVRVRRGAMLLAAAVAALALAFVGGYLAGNGGKSASGHVLHLSGTAAAPHALASLQVEPKDAAGNWPMKLTVEGLPVLPHGSYYEMYLVRNGKPWGSCGTFDVATQAGHDRLADRAVPAEARRQLGRHPRDLPRARARSGRPAADLIG